MSNSLARLFSVVHTGEKMVKMMTLLKVMAEKFAERGGIHTLLLANEEYNGGSDDMKLGSRG
jgi:hypothetical protein